MRIQNGLLESGLFPKEDQSLMIFKNKIDKITNEIKSKLAVKFQNKQKEIKISFAPSEHLKIRCDETVVVSGINSYFTNMFYELLIKTENSSYEEIYFVIKKVQSLVAFCKTNFDKISFEYEVLFSKINELVFLQTHDLIDHFIVKFNEFIKYVKVSGPKFKKIGQSNLANKEELTNILKSKLITLRMKTKILFAMALTYSDQKHHDKAIANAQKALKCGYSTLQTTLCVVYWKMYQKNQKLKATSDGSVRQKLEKKLEQLHNISNIITSILKRIESTKDLFNKSSKITTNLAFFKSLVEDIGEPTESENPDIDMKYLNNPEIINTSLLKESTILHLTSLNFVSFDHEINHDLSEEYSEKFLLDKIANISVSFYILSVEHRFNEHNNFSNTRFYKNLLDYFNPTFSTKHSEVYLSKAVELAYLYLPDCFPFVSQILLVFKNFELNRSKQIPENGDEPETATYLVPFKNGFKSALIIPIIRNIQSNNSKIPSLKDSTKEKDKENCEPDFVNEKLVIKNFEKNPQATIKRIYDPKNKPTQKPEKKITGVMRSPELANSKQISTLKLKVFKPPLTQNLIEPENASVFTTPALKNNSQKVKKDETIKKQRIGSSKVGSGKDTEAVKSEKRANSSEFSRNAMATAKDAKTKTSAQPRFPSKGIKNDMSLLKSTEFLFHDSYKKMTLKLKSNNENLDLNKKSPFIGQLKSNNGDKRVGRLEGSVPVSESNSKENSTNFFLQHFSQKNSPFKTNTGFKINGGGKIQQTVYFQNFIRNKNNIAEILSKFK